MGLQVTSKEFIDALWEGISAGYAYSKVFQEASDGTLETTDAFHSWPGQSQAFLDELVTPDGVAFIGTAIRSDKTTDPKNVARVCSFWTTINLNLISFDRVIEALKAFPAKPSAGYIVQNVLHVFWFVKESMGPDDFKLVWSANTTIWKKLGLGDSFHYDPILEKAKLQAEHYEPRGLIRVPGQPETKFVAWHPEIRYGIDEFCDLVSPPKPKPSASPATPAPNSRPQKPVEIPEEVQQKMVDSMAEIWIGDSPMALHFGGMFFRAGISQEAATSILESAAQKAGASVSKIKSGIQKTYARALEGEPVSGIPSLIKLIDEKLPLFARDKAKKTVERVKKLTPKPPRGGGDDGDDEKKKTVEPNFEVIKIIKYDSRPAQYKVTIQRYSDSKPVEVSCDTRVVTNFRAFRNSFFEASENLTLAMISQGTWDGLLENAPHEIKPAPQEASTMGAIRTELETFMEERRESPDVGELKAYAGYNEKDVFFRLIAFKAHLKEYGVRPNDQELTHVLNDLGWVSKKQRFGDRTARIWYRALSQSGNGQGNGNGKAQSQDGGQSTLFGPKGEHPEKA